MGGGERVDSEKREAQPLGALLVEQGALDETAMTEALAVQVEDGKRLGEILLERDLVSRPLLARALATAKRRRACRGARVR